MHSFHFSLFRSQQRSQPILHVIGLSHLSWRNSQNRRKNTRIKARFTRPRSAQNVHWLYLNASVYDRNVPRTWLLGSVDTPILLWLLTWTGPSRELGINYTHLKLYLLLQGSELDTQGEAWRFRSGDCVTVASSRMWHCRDIAPVFHFYYPVNLKKTLVPKSQPLLGYKLIFRRVIKMAKDAAISFVMSVRPYGITRLPLDRIIWNLMFDNFSKICLEISSFLKIWQD